MTTTVSLLFPLRREALGGGNGCKPSHLRFDRSLTLFYCLIFFVVTFFFSFVFSTIKIIKIVPVFLTGNNKMTRYDNEVIKKVFEY